MNILQSLSDAENLLTDLQKCDEIALDTESAGLDYYNDKLLLVQLEVCGNIYIIDVIGFGKKNLKYLINLINNTNKAVVIHNAKYDINVLLANTDILLTRVYDTMLIESLLTAGIGNYLYSYQELCNNYLEVIIDKDIRDEFINATVVTQEMLIYASLDVKYLREIKRLQEERIKNLKLEKVVNLELKLVPAVAKMEYDGVLLDVDKWRNIIKDNEKQKEYFSNEILSELVYKNKKLYENKTALEVCDDFYIPVKTKRDRTALSEITDFDSVANVFTNLFNISSYKQLTRALNLVGIPVDSVNEKILKDYKKETIISNILEYKSYDKLISTYGEKVISVINPKTNRIHSSFNQVGTTTGRFSSSKPNLHNQPRDNRYRNCFIARPEFKIVTSDYSQAELRLMGAVSGEPKIIEAYLNGTDIHRLTASLIYDKKLENVTDDDRFNGKTVNFAVIYGTSAYGLYYNLGIPLEDAFEYLKNYFLGYNKLARFIELAGEKVWELKYSKTPLGRIRFFEDKPYYADYKELEWYKKKVMREGVNHIIQGGSADILKIAINNIFYNNPFDDKLRVLMNVHDELVAEVHESILDDGVEFITNSMEEAEQPFLGVIPAKVDYKIDNYWTK